MNKKRMAIAVAIALAAPCVAWARDAAMPQFSLQRLWHAGLREHESGPGRIRDLDAATRGAKKKSDFGVDSLLAGQIDARFTKALSFVGQIVANRTADDDFVPHVDWAFVRYAITPNLSVRGGILAVPIFLQSDSHLTRPRSSR